MSSGAFALDRTIGSTADSYLGFTTSASTGPDYGTIDVYGSEKYSYGMDMISETSKWKAYTSSVNVPTVTPSNATLQAALGGTTNFAVVYRS